MAKSTKKDTTKQIDLVDSIEDVKASKKSTQVDISSEDVKASVKNNQPYDPIQQFQKKSDFSKDGIAFIGSLGLTRRWVDNPKIIKFLIDQDDYIQMVSKSISLGLTTDEYIRSIIKAQIQQS